MLLVSFLLLAASSLLGSTLLFPHRRLLTWLAVAGALAEVQWLLLTLLGRTVFVDVPRTAVFIGGSIVLLGCWLLVWRISQVRLRVPRPSKADFFIGVPLTLVLAAALLVSNFNDLSTENWLTHGFYNGDTTTLLALTQRSLVTTEMVDQNPFAANGALEYPTLVHAGLAELLQFAGAGYRWFHWLPALTFAQILITIPLFFLLFDVIWPEPAARAERWFGIGSRWTVHALQAGMVLYLLALSWDNYVYPQGHFFLTALFLLQAALLLRASTARGNVAGAQRIAALLCGVMLLRANAVTGTAAITLLLAYFGARALTRSVEVRERVGAAALLPVLILAFFAWTPGSAQFGLPNFSYTAAGDMLRLSPVLLLVLFAAWQGLSRHATATLLTVVVAVLAAVTFIFSTRNIVIDNASRFFYHALLIGTPLALPLLIRAGYLLRRELRYTTHTLVEQLTAWGVVGLTLFILALPAGASVLSAHDNLMFKDEQHIPPGVHEAAAWLSENAPPDAIVLANPEPPWAVPLLTGRALVRADYWLSPDDALLKRVQAAVMGDSAAQQHVLNEADYLLLTRTDEIIWDTTGLEAVVQNADAMLYRVR